MRIMFWNRPDHRASSVLTASITAFESDPVLDLVGDVVASGEPLVGEVLDTLRLLRGDRSEPDLAALGV
jgi:hypothetical protein